MSDATARYAPGDRVRVLTDAPTTHHRTPGYAKGRTARIAVVCGAFPDPEKRAYGSSGLPRVCLYRVEFDQSEVWDGYRGSPQDKVYLDVYEHWLEPA